MFYICFMNIRHLIVRLKPPVTRQIIVLIFIICIALNLILSFFNNIILKSPLFLDSIFTAVAAVLYGPVIGMGIGLISNIGMEFIYGFTGIYWPFAMCNLATGLILGLMSRNGYFTKNIHLPLAILAVTFTNVILGSLIAYFVFDGYTLVQIDHIVSALADLGMSISSSTFWARIPSNLIDKMITVYIAFGLSRYILSIPKRNI